jgi:hypothetical protein
LSWLLFQFLKFFLQSLSRLRLCFCLRTTSGQREDDQDRRADGQEGFRNHNPLLTQKRLKMQAFRRPARGREGHRKTHKTSLIERGVAVPGAAMAVFRGFWFPSIIPVALISKIGLLIVVVIGCSKPKGHDYEDDYYWPHSGGAHVTIRV